MILLLETNLRKARKPRLLMSGESAIGLGWTLAQRLLKITKKSWQMQKQLYGTGQWEYSNSKSFPTAQLALQNTWQGFTAQQSLLAAETAHQPLRKPDCRTNSRIFQLEAAHRLSFLKERTSRA